MYAYKIVIIFGSYKLLLHAECAALEGTIGAVLTFLHDRRLQ